MRIPDRRAELRLERLVGYVSGDNRGENEHVHEECLLLQTTTTSASISVRGAKRIQRSPNLGH